MYVFVLSIVFIVGPITGVLALPLARSFSSLKVSSQLFSPLISGCPASLMRLERVKPSIDPPLMKKCWINRMAWVGVSWKRPAPGDFD